MMLPDMLKQLFVKKSKQKEITLPDNLFVQCPQCKATVYQRKLRANSDLCPECGYHFVLTVEQWLEVLTDRKTWQEECLNLSPIDTLHFPKYGERLEQLARKEKSEAISVGTARIEGIKVQLGIMNPNFLMGSLGSVAGEKITQLFEQGLQRRVPVVLVIRSGGARMQEGVLSLMQMAKTSAAIKRFQDGGLLYVAILTHPTTGGVSASFAMLGDIILGEPQALIGFAGPRVIEQTIKQKLPDGFQKAEYLLSKGFLDAIVSRVELKAKLSQILQLHGYLAQEAK